MTLLLNRAIEGAKTHAFIIGVGNYPFAKPGKGIKQSLGEVPDLPSAADSAKLMCDWLLKNQDVLSAPLATLEVLISDPINPTDRYPWAGGPIDGATVANVTAAGYQWFRRVIDEPGNIAFFYCCGHGASHLQQPVVFLEDLNHSSMNVWTHINVVSLANSLRKCQGLSAAFMFSDTCGEFVTEFELANAQDCRFYDALNPLVPSRNQVSLLCAAPEGQMAYEGEAEGSLLKFGRFTQTVLQGLSGSSARFQQNRWGVKPLHLLDDLTSLRHVFFSHWNDDYAFEPSQVVTPTDPIPIVYPQAFELPLVVVTDPLDRMAHYDFFISQKNDPTPPWLQTRAAGNSSAWRTTVPPGRGVLYAIAVKDTEHHLEPFQPKEPLFNHSVTVP